MPFINFLNKTDLNLKVLIIYAEKIIAESNTFKKDFYEILYVADDASDVLLQINYESEKGDWLSFTNVNLNKISDDSCFEISGDLSNANIQSTSNCINSVNASPPPSIEYDNFLELPTLNSNMERIQIKNTKPILARAYIGYSLGDSTVTNELISTILPLETKEILIPKLASNIYLEFQVLFIQEDLIEQWRVVDKHSYTTLSQKYFTINHSLSYNNDTDYLPQLPFTPHVNYSSSKNSYYIKVENKSNFIVKFTLQYGIRGESKPRVYTLLITIGKTNSLAIPSTASLIYLTIESKKGTKVFKDFYMSPESHCFQITGTEKAPSIKEIKC